MDKTCNSATNKEKKKKTLKKQECERFEKPKRGRGNVSLQGYTQHAARNEKRNKREKEEEVLGFFQNTKKKKKKRLKMSPTARRKT